MQRPEEVRANAMTRRSGRPSWRTSSRASVMRAEGGVAAEEDEVRATLVGANQVWVEAGEPGAEAGEGVAGGEDEVMVAAGRVGERRGPARRALLEEGDVPLGGEEDAGELGEEVAVDLDVGVVSLGGAKRAWSEGCGGQGRAARSRP